MITKPFLALGLVPQLVSAIALHARQTVTCNFEVAANTGDTCSSFASDWGLTDAEFLAINPEVSCPGNLEGGQNYCVLGTTGGSSTTTTAKLTTTSSSTAKSTTSTTSSKSTSSIINSSKSTTGTTTKPPTTTQGPTTTTTTTPTSSTPSPLMPSIVSNCNAYYQVQSGDGCDAIEKAKGITSANFLAWNPYVDSKCDNLWLGYYVCVGVSATTATTATKPTTTSSGTPTGPSPQMPSITSTCDKFYLVASGDSCDIIEQKEDVTSAHFLAWNKYVDAACDNLWLGYYVCVGV